MGHETRAPAGAEGLTASGDVCKYAFHSRDGLREVVNGNGERTGAQLEALHSGQAELIGILADGKTVVVWTESEKREP